MEVCCLPGSRVKDVKRKLATLLWPSDYYPLLIFHVGSDEVASRGQSKETSGLWDDWLRDQENK